MLCAATLALLMSNFINIPIISKKDKKITGRNGNFLNVYLQSLKHIVAHWYLTLAICIVAFTEASFTSNSSLIGFSLGATPDRWIFLLSALGGVINWASAIIYPRIFSTLEDNTKQMFLIISFLLIFVFAGILSLFSFDISNIYFFPILIVILDCFGEWWAIYISSAVRKTSPAGAYGQTMASFRAPRAFTTFMGILLIGSALEHSSIKTVMFLNVLFIFTLILAQRLNSFYSPK